MLSDTLVDLVVNNKSRSEPVKLLVPHCSTQ